MNKTPKHLKYKLVWLNRNIAYNSISVLLCRKKTWVYQEVCHAHLLKVFLRVWCPELSSPKTLDWLHHSVSIYCCFLKQSSLLCDFEARPDPMPRFQWSWPGCRAVLFTSPLKVSVTRADIPDASASQVHHMLSVCQLVDSDSGPDWCTVWSLQFCGFSVKF